MVYNARLNGSVKVVFTRPDGPYSTGDLAGFTADFAAVLVECGVAEYHVDTQPEEIVEAKPQKADLGVTTSGAGHPLVGGRRRS
jgi:hypothetical protein